MFVSLFSAAVLMTGPATAEQAAAAPGAAAAIPATKVAAKSDKYGVVCKFEQLSGSRFVKKVCYIPSELAAKQREDRQALEKLQSFPRDGGH